MNLGFLRLTVIGIAVILIGAACMPQTTPPPVDAMATAVARAASDLLTQTAASFSPTPPPPTVTSTPNPTATATITPAGSQSLKPTVLRNFAACWFGPGPATCWRATSRMLRKSKFSALEVCLAGILS